MNQNANLLLDTHIWIWWVNQSPPLTEGLRATIEKAAVVAISAASLYELIWLVERGRLSLTLEIGDWIQIATADSGIEVVGVSGQIAQIAAGLPPIHGDPLDRMIIATALSSGQPLMSLDNKFTNYTELVPLLITV